MRNKTVEDITLFALLIAVYVAITVSLSPITYGLIQFRVSEIILLLPFYNKKFILPSILAVAIANAFSTLNPLADIIVGVLIAIISYTLIIKIKNKYIDALLYSLLCGLLVGAEIAFFAESEKLYEFYLALASITFSQAIICVSGIFLINRLYKIKYFKERILD